MTQYWGGGGGKKHFFLLILHNFKNITRPPPHPLLRGPCGTLDGIEKVRLVSLKLAKVGTASATCEHRV